MANGQIQIVAANALVMGSGGASMAFSKDGTIAVQGSKEIGASVSNSSVKLDARKAAVAGPSVEVNAVGQAKIQGAIVKIN